MEDEAANLPPAAFAGAAAAFFAGFAAAAAVPLPEDAAGAACCCFARQAAIHALASATLGGTSVLATAITTRLREGWLDLAAGEVLN